MAHSRRRLGTARTMARTPWAAHCAAECGSKRLGRDSERTSTCLPPAPAFTHQSFSGAADASPPQAVARERPHGLPDLADVRGQESAKRAPKLRLRRAQSTHDRPAWSGKSMLAQRLPSILPPLSPKRCSTFLWCIHLRASSWAGSCARSDRFAHRITREHASLWVWNAGHAQAKSALRTLGCFFLDDCRSFNPRFSMPCASPLESGEVIIASAPIIAFSILRVAACRAMNHADVAAVRRDVPAGCQVWRRSIKSRISGPLLDRIDLQIEMPPFLPRSRVAAFRRGECGGCGRG